MKWSPVREKRGKRYDFRMGGSQTFFWFDLEELMAFSAMDTFFSI